MKDPGIDRKKSPKPVDFSVLPLNERNIGFDQIKAEQFHLSNGIPVYWVKMGQTDILKIEVIFNAGYYHQPASLVASFTNHLLKEGTTTRSSAEIAGMIDFYGSSLSYDTDKERAGISLYAQSKHLENLIPLLSDILINPSFPEPEFNLLLMNKRQQFQVDMQRVSYLAGRKMQEVLYGKGHPYGVTLEEADFEKLTLTQIKNFYLNYYTPSNCTVIIAGPEHAPLPELLNKYLGHYKRRKSNLLTQEIPFGEIPAGEEILLPKEDALQNAIRIGKRTITPTHPDYMGLKVLNTLFGGYFGSRLMKNIREDKGFTYGIGSTLIPYDKTGAFVIYTEAGAGIAREAMNEILKELEKIQTDPFGEQELKLVKNYMIGSFLRSIDGVFEVASRFKDIIFFGLPEGYHKKSLEEIQQIRPDRLRALAQKYLDPSSMFRLMAGSV